MVDTRDASTSTYCTYASSRGCNAWASVTDDFTLYYPNGGQASATYTYTGTVTQNASLNTFLNGDYYNNPNTNIDYLGEDKTNIVEHEFYIGTPGHTTDTESIETDTGQEKSYTWDGKVGLIQATDYLKASTDVACINLNVAYSDGANCGTTNWLKPSSGYTWTISPAVTGYRHTVYIVSSSGNLYGYSTTFASGGVYPVVHLDANIKLDGNGTELEPYSIK